MKKLIITEQQAKILNETDLLYNENFKRWFGGSKVVKNGKPLVVYHGSMSNLDKFRPSKSIGTHGETDQIEGIYFTDNKDAASWYALSDDERFTKPCYLSLVNPYIVEDHRTLKSELGIDNYAEANKKMKSLGYDGLIMERGFYTRGLQKLYLAFYSTQVKSITNDGSWDIKDENIYS